MQTSDSKDVASVFVKVFGCRAHDPERSLFGPKSHGARTDELMLSKPTRRQQRSKRYLGACPNSRCSILSESDSTFGYEQVFSPLEYRSDAASAAECAGLRAERPCVAVYR